MSVSLENLFMANKSIQNTQTGGQIQPVNSAVNQLLQDMFSTGDVISGKVSSMQGNVVELLLPSGQSLSAILGQNVSVNMGEQMMFAVKGYLPLQAEITERGIQQHQNNPRSPDFSVVCRSSLSSLGRVVWLGQHIMVSVISDGRRHTRSNSRIVLFTPLGVDHGIAVVTAGERFHHLLRGLLRHS